MTSIQQRAELQRRIWQIANDVRGAVDGWDFKQYVLGSLFYRFISENFASYIEGGDDSVDYEKLPDSVITADIKDDAIKTKGYFIYPSQLFVNVVANANTNESLNTDLAAIFAAIESSANGYPSEKDIKGLFADFDTTSNRLGNTVKDKNIRLTAVLKGVADLDFGDFEGSRIDLLLQAPGRPDCYVEVKNVTAAVEGGVGYFPDAVTTRGAKHLREMSAMVAAGSRAVLVFCVQRGDVTEVRPADPIDPAYGQALRDALAAGVEVIALGATVSPEGITLERRLAVVVP